MESNMSDFIVSTSELNEMKPFFAKHNFSDLVKKIEQANNWTDKAGNKVVQHSIDRLYIFDNKFVLNHDNLIKDLYEHTKNKSFNIAHFIESKIHTGYSSGDAFNGYVRLIKNTDYSNNSDAIYKVIEKATASTNKIFWSMVTLATYIQDTTLSLKAFYLILKDKKNSIYSFGLLDLEKIKRVFDKHFKNVDLKTLPKKEYEFITKSFDELNISKTKSFCTTTSGHYLDVFVDINLICQENKLSKGKNSTTLTGMLYSLAAYVETAKDTCKTLSITKLIIRDEDYKTLSFHAVFYYDDASQAELIKSFVGDLIDYAIVKGKNGQLQGEDINNQNSEQFFASLIMNHSLENTLDKKEETKLKKNKI
jgi:hypothetical protein